MDKGKFHQNSTSVLLYSVACGLQVHYLVLVIIWEREKYCYMVLIDVPSILKWKPLELNH